MGTDHQPQIKPTQGKVISRTLAPTHRTKNLVQRSRNIPNERLEISDLMQFQQVIGNRATQQMLRSNVNDGVVQRQYVGEQIIYSDIKREKKAGEIHTGSKLHSTLTKRVKVLHEVLKKGDFKKIKAALDDIMERLDLDSQKKLKPPKTKGFSVGLQTQMAITFFTKWKNITQAHIDHLNTYGSAGAVDLQVAYGYVSSQQNIVIDDTESGASTSTSSSSFSFDAPPWGSIEKADVIGSGKGGAVIVTLGGGNKIVVKRNSPGEVMGARMARESGLDMPQTRLAVEGESQEIKEALSSVRVDEQNKWETPYTIIEYVDGTSVTTAFSKDEKIDMKQVGGLAASMGRWFAFNLLTGDNDNFSRLLGGPMGGVNTGNYMVDSKKPNKVTAIDQTVMGGDSLKSTGDAIENILAGDGFFAMGIANDIVKALGSPKGVDGEDLIPIILQAAKEQLQQSTRVLTREKILELNKDLDLYKIGEVIDRVESIAKQF